MNIPQKEYDIQKSQTVRLDDDGYLLQKSIHKSKIKHMIDWKSLGITKEYITEQSRLKHSGFDENFRFIDKRERPGDTKESRDRYFITSLCLPYNPLPDEKDIFVYYNDIGALCGDAGYIRIRDGYVYGRIIEYRS